LAALFVDEGRFLWPGFVTRDVDLDRQGLIQPDFLSNGPRREAESKNTGFPSRKRWACASQRMRRSDGLLYASSSEPG
jgi:hypothetical protein